MKQYTENLYDDDLTVETDDYEYDDSYSRDGVDLFEFSTDEESPISHLKSLILSIDWEITDEVLMAFSEELEALRALWTDEKVNLIYIQALEKISKYIYHKKANSHPNAIKLLLTLYYNLEKIVSTEDLSGKEKKMILLEDVKRFEALKRQISKTAYDLDAPQPETQLEHLEEPVASGGSAAAADEFADGDVLLDLKAIVLGIDWEITDQDLNRLREEVVRLEELFADSRPKLILLQGIGTLGAYIKLKKSEAHADAFTLLHTIYSSLEQIVKTPMSLEEEKAVLFPVVDTFNAFKKLVGPTITEKTVDRNIEPEEKVEYPAATDTVVPAFADISDDEARGFQADEEAKALGLTEDDTVGSHVDDFFAEDSGDFSSGQGQEITAAAAESGNLGGKSAEKLPPVAKDIALQGLDVEEDDETADTDADGIAPALSGAAAGKEAVASLSSMDHEPAEKRDDRDVEEHVQSPGGESVFSEASPAGETAADIEAGRIDTPDKDIALQGVDVETEADDDSDEESLPTLGGELAPALAENDEISFYNTENLESLKVEAGIEEEILQNIDGLFDAAEDPLPLDASNLESAAEPSGAVSSEPEPGEVETTLAEPETIAAATAAAQVPPSEEVVFVLVEDEEVLHGVPYPSGALEEIAGALESFQRGVRSLENEFDNTLLLGLMQQLAALRQECEENPLEMTFLQLLSTIIRYIDRYRLGAGAETYELLYYVSDALGQVQGGQANSNQRLLLAATTKVLDWQQGLLAQ